MALVPTQKLQPPANDPMLNAGSGQLNQSWAQYFQRVSDQTQSLSDTLHTGTILADDAPAGQVGEYITSNIVLSASVPLASNAPRTVTTISLTPGDWDVWGSVGISAPLSTSRTYIAGACSLSAALSGLPTGGGLSIFSGPAATGEAGVYPVTQGRLSIAAATTVFLVAQSGFTVSTMRAYGFIAARRAR